MKNTYIITGAGKGTGRYFAKTIHKGDVALISRTRADLESLREELLAINPKMRISIHPADLSNPNQTKLAFDEIKNIHGNSIKAVICFASAWVKSKSLDELTQKDFLEGLQANFFNTFNTIKETIRITSPDLAGLSIITICGTSGTWMNPEAPIMSVAKGAISNYSRVLAKQLIPQQVHVAHIIIDGPILNERGKLMNEHLQENEFIKLESVAKEIHHVINQSEDAWTFEWDIRPFTRNTRLI